MAGKARTVLGQIADQMSTTQSYPKTIEEAMERGANMNEHLLSANARQKAGLDRATALLKDAIDQCTCGGVQRAMESQTAKQARGSEG